MDGIIIINKPKGFTSQDVVSKVKKILNEKKAGHAGTLDPLATGVLPVMLGNCTKLSKYLMEHNKVYRATIKLGEKSDTGDLEGAIIERKPVPENLTFEKVDEFLKSFLGKQMQTPPMYSAIKVNGKKLYEYARAGEQVEIPKREIEIYSIKLLNISKISNKDKENDFSYELEFEVSCSKGTYIRTLCENIAEKLGTVGVMKSLERVKVDNFEIQNSYTFEDLENGNYKIFSMEEIFKDLPKILLNSRKKELFLNGVRLTFEVPDGVYNVYLNDEYIGIGEVHEKLLKREVVN